MCSFYAVQQLEHLDKGNVGISEFPKIGDPNMVP